MNKRDAKREAYFHASVMLRNVMEGGWAVHDDPRYSEADADRLDAAMYEVIAMLENRATLYQDPDETPARF